MIFHFGVFVLIFFLVSGFCCLILSTSGLSEYVTMSSFPIVHLLKYVKREIYDIRGMETVTPQNVVSYWERGP